MEPISTNALLPYSASCFPSFHRRYFETAAHTLVSVRVLERAGTEPIKKYRLIKQTFTMYPAAKQTTKSGFETG